MTVGSEEKLIRRWIDQLRPFGSDGGVPGIITLPSTLAAR
jgi:hypothetical protein